MVCDLIKVRIIKEIRDYLSDMLEFDVVFLFVAGERASIGCEQICRVPENNCISWPTVEVTCNTGGLPGGL